MGKPKFITNQELQNYFNSLNSKIELIDELAIAEKIKNILTTDGQVITNKFDQAEYIAFYFWANDNGGSKKQDRYYFPMMSGTTKDGNVVEFPDSRIVDDDIIEYWKDRATASKHPFLINRYADLVVDFQKRKEEGKFDYLMAQRVVDSAIQICNQSLDDGLGCKEKLKRALFLSTLINDAQRLEQIKQNIIDTERKFAEDDKPGLWGYGFEWLVLDGNLEKTLTSTHKITLIGDLENRLNRLMSATNPSAWNVECAVSLLAKYYSKAGDERNIEIVLSQLEQTYRKNLYTNSDGLLVVNYLEKLSDVYLLYANFSFAKAAIQRIKQEMSNLSKHTSFDLKKFSVDMEMKKEDIDTVLNSAFGEKRDFKLGQTIKHVAVTYVPRKDKMEKELKELSSKYVYLSLGNHSILSTDGFSSAKYGSVQEDFERHLLNHFSQNLHFQSGFLRLVLGEMTKIKKVEEVFNELALSPVFQEDDKYFLFEVLKKYWSGDYLSASCLMIPLIEDSIRNIYRLNNLSFISSNDDGGYDVESLNKLLERGVIRQIYSAFGDHVEYYFRVLLTERIGWNLRNNFAHGINKNAFTRIDVADRLLQVLFCLSLVRLKEKKCKND
ncbi:MAG: hypothetical protein KCHDKBKB_03064 [Elusimicrobia bacterium]|nr:hypothetical protein [Elusimicrobiota bacterium]